MNDDAACTGYHPRWLRTRVSTWWWLQRWPYLKFILRELSSVFVAWFVIFFLLLLHAVGRGETAWLQFLDWAGQPFVITLNVISLLFVVFHTITWFNLAPRAIALHFRGKHVAPFWIAAPNYIAWLIVSVIVVWMLAGNR